MQGHRLHEVTVINLRKVSNILEVFSAIGGFSAILMPLFKYLA